MVSPQPRGSCSSQPATKVDPAVRPLTAFMGQDGKATAAARALDTPFKHRTPQVSPRVPRAQLSQASVSLTSSSGCVQPSGHLSPARWQGPGAPVRWRELTHLWDVRSPYLWGVEGKQVVFKTEAKTLSLLLGTRAPPGTGSAVPSSDKKSKRRNRSASCRAWAGVAGCLLSAVRAAPGQASSSPGAAPGKPAGGTWGAASPAAPQEAEIPDSPRPQVEANPGQTVLLCGTRLALSLSYR